jgi:hypothetical protein
VLRPHESRGEPNLEWKQLMRHGILVQPRSNSEQGRRRRVGGVGSTGRGCRQYRSGVSAVQACGSDAYVEATVYVDLVVGGARSGDAQATVEAALAEAGKPRWGRPGGQVC